MNIHRPVRPMADGTDRIMDAGGYVLGTMDIVNGLNEQTYDDRPVIVVLARILGGERASEVAELLARFYNEAVADARGHHAHTEHRIFEIERQLKEVRRSWVESSK